MVKNKLKKKDIIPIIVMLIMSVLILFTIYSFVSSLL